MIRKKQQVHVVSRPTGRLGQPPLLLHLHPGRAGIMTFSTDDPRLGQHEQDSKAVAGHVADVPVPHLEHPLSQRQALHGVVATLTPACHTHTHSEGGSDIRQGGEERGQRRPLALTVDDLLVGQHGPERRAPVHQHLRLLRQTPEPPTINHHIGTRRLSPPAARAATPPLSAHFSKSLRKIHCVHLT